MIKAFLISFRLKNAYRVNSIIFSIRQLPLIKKILPQSLYRSRALKIIAGIIAAIWELMATFLGKAIYLMGMIMSMGLMYDNVEGQRVFVHLLFFLTIPGTYLNTYMFDPTNDKYYAMMIMRMDARLYTLSNYAFNILKVVVGFLPFSLLAGLSMGAPVWLCLLIAFFVAAAKMTAAWVFILHYEKTGRCVNENFPPKLSWVLSGLMIALAYGLPFLGISLPVYVFAAIAAATIAVGIFAAFRIAAFDRYREMYQLVLADKRSGIDRNQLAKQMIEEQNRKNISFDGGISSKKRGFDYFNEIFIKRHRRILWRSSKKIAAICLALLAGAILILQMKPETGEGLNSMMMQYLPYFVFIMYAINRGPQFTQALFMNCDHSMLTYSFYKKPEFILKLFTIRLREIIKVNLLPALVIGLGLPVLLYISGGTDNPLNYVILPVSIFAMSIFFSVHYLVCYYIFQPYNVETELKGGVYKVVTWVTYLICFVFMQVRMDTLVFGAIVSAFCIIYSVAACVIVYRLAPGTFKLRQ